MEGVICGGGVVVKFVLVGCIVVVGGVEGEEVLLDRCDVVDNVFMMIL